MLTWNALKAARFKPGPKGGAPAEASAKEASATDAGNPHSSSRSYPAPSLFAGLHLGLHVALFADLLDQAELGLEIVDMLFLGGEDVGEDLAGDEVLGLFAIGDRLDIEGGGPASRSSGHTRCIPSGSRRYRSWRGPAHWAGLQGRGCARSADRRASSRRWIPRTRPRRSCRSPQSLYMRACRKYWFTAASSSLSAWLRYSMTLASPFMAHLP